MIWFAPFEGSGDDDPLVPFARPGAPADPNAGGSPAEPEHAAGGDERPPPRCSIK